MAKFEIKMSVDYIFEIEADSESDAEQLAWDYDYIDDSASYDGVSSIQVTEVYEDEEDDEEGEES